MADLKVRSQQPDMPGARKGFLRSLLRSESGNVLFITAAATIPMLGVVGGAIDISRVYLTKSRIQSACDSAVLAGRKAMSTAEYTTAAKARGTSMFNANFQDEDYGTTGTVFNSSADVAGKVSGTATTSVPMVLMQIFGIGSQSITVTCSADIQVPNIDIVLVLDVTGSMDEWLNGKKKIDSLKEAAKDFYDTMEDALAGNTTSQIRYAFVPYSEAVNGLDVFKSSPVAANGELSLSHFADTMVVQSRVANFNTPTSATWTPDLSVAPTTINQVYETGVANSREPFVASSTSGTGISTFDCDQYSSNRSFTIGSNNQNVYLYPLTSWPNGEEIGNSVLYQKDGTGSWLTSEPTNSTSYYYKLTFERVSFVGSGTYQICTRRVTKTKYTKQTGYKFTDWSYKPVTYNVSGFKAGSALTYLSSVNTSATVPTAGSYDLVQLAGMGVGTNSTTTWQGCIEERDTVAASTFSPIPSGAYDLNFLDGGTASHLRWRPVLRDLTYDRERVDPRLNTTNTDWEGKPGHSCPTARMRSLNVMTETQYDNYIDTLQPAGNTYLDVGMIWGLRLIAPQGLFASRNLIGPNGGQISRHIIFLTDGVPAAADTRYTAYGVERMAARITGTTGVSLATLHSRRFQALCDAQRGSVSIWAIAFGTSVSGNLSSCADPGRAYQADNTAQLKTAFTNIAKEVADLRLVE